MNELDRLKVFTPLSTISLCSILAPSCPFLWLLRRNTGRFCYLRLFSVDKFFQPRNTRFLFLNHTLQLRDFSSAKRKLILKFSRTLLLPVITRLPNPRLFLPSLNLGFKSRYSLRKFRLNPGLNLSIYLLKKLLCE